MSMARRQRSRAQAQPRPLDQTKRLGSQREVFASQQIDRTQVAHDAKRARKWKILIGFSVVMVFALVALLLGMATKLVGIFTKQNPTLLEAVIDPIGPWWLAAALWVGVPGILGGVMSLLMRRQMAAQAAMNSVDDINQHKGDARLATPDELVQEYPWFPDAGFHADIDVTTIVSHVLIDSDDRRLGSIFMADGQPVQVDGQLGKELLETSGLEPEMVTEVMRRRRQRLGSDPALAAVRDQITATWSHPAFEPARPAGAYLVDTRPANTTVIGITRAGKGQTLIMPWLDIQLRSTHPSNLVVNDPKGELVVAFYGPATARGFDVVQFNLINPTKTDRYNPLGMAAMAARMGEHAKCATYIENMATTFFPPGGQDPFWNSAAGAAFKRVAYALIDMHLEAEWDLDLKAAREGWSPSRKAVALDALWAGVTLYNTFQMFITLSSVNVARPAARAKAFTDACATVDPVSGGSPQNDALRVLAPLIEAETQTLWNGHSDDNMDGLSLYFRAMRHLPVSETRQRAINEDASLRAMGGSERTISSVYGIALAAMTYFSDPTVMALTSGPPSETVDISGLSFPRRLAVRFDPQYVRDRALGGSQVRWSAYADPLFSRPLGNSTWVCSAPSAKRCRAQQTGPLPDDELCPTCEAAMVDVISPDPGFSHTDTLSANGWAYFYLREVIPGEVAYVLLEVVSAVSGTVIETLRFRFDKGYRRTDRGRTIVSKPLTGEPIVRDGLLTEVSVGGGDHVSAYAQDLVTKDEAGIVQLAERNSPIIRSTSVRYSESVKAMFLITPPHLDKYARLLLILLRDMVDLNFEASYMTRTNQKPDYGTKFMLDEVGNLQSEGHGLRGLETLLSIGLGQNQQFHLILQSLQQLTEVYGGSVESILQSNTANLIFLKSTDTELIEKLSKMSGQRHVAYRSSKTVTKDMEDLLQFKSVEGRVSYTMGLDTENVILANDLAFMPERNWIVFRNGQYPVWNRDETIMPMAYRLLAEQPPVGQAQFSFQNLPSLSNAGAYDPRQDTPDFEAALRRICAQAMVAADSTAEYLSARGLAENETRLMDPDFYAEQVMGLVQTNCEASETLDEAIARLRAEYSAAGWLVGSAPPSAPGGASTGSGGSSGSGSGGGAAAERWTGDKPLAASPTAAGDTVAGVVVDVDDDFWLDDEPPFD
jgi:type IV secretory pathway TraG/TraD family ATPase VirD4